MCFFSQYNDLLMRGGMPALLVLCYYCGGHHCTGWTGDCARRAEFPPFRPRGRDHSVVRRRTSPHTLNWRGPSGRYCVPVRTLRVHDVRIADPYTAEILAPEIPDLLRWLLRKADAGPRREKAEPVVRAGFDVYLNGRRGSSSMSRNTVVGTILNR